MDVSFCKSCDNLLYLYIDDEENELYNCCKSCGSKEKLNKDLQLVYNNDNQTIDKGEYINNNPYICHDITLPVIENNPNIKCQNELCDANETSIKYIKYDEINMKYIYICNHCGCKWKNNL
tara:strand:- start:14 stop:376 length:363 start_codon:yes stop_codon:yes gene_type:complete